MGRKTDMSNDDDDDDDEQQSSSTVSRMTPNSIKHESPYKFHRHFDENHMNDDGNDLLIHDTILPHRKRVRKDTLQYFQHQQSTATTEMLDVSLFSSCFISSPIHIEFHLVYTEI